MSMGIKKYPSLSQLKFRRFPTKPRKRIEIVRVNDMLFGRCERTGSIFTDYRSLTGRLPVDPHKWPRLPTVMRALVLLNAVPQFVADGVLERAEKENHRREVKELLDCYVPMFSGLVGIELTPEQLEKFKIAMGEKS